VTFIPEFKLQKKTVCASQLKIVLATTPDNDLPEIYYY